jgi:hypothetical protein
VSDQYSPTSTFVHEVKSEEYAIVQSEGETANLFVDGAVGFFRSNRGITQFQLFQLQLDRSIIRLSQGEL